MAALMRQPFAPIDRARLQNLSSLKNRQNALAAPSSGKRNAELLDVDDSENVDPLVIAKRSKAAASSTTSKDGLHKPSPHVLPRPVSTPRHHARQLDTPPKPASTPRRTLQPTSPAAKLRMDATKSSPLSAPAGRSPTRTKRSRILSIRHHTSGPYTRVDPPSFGLGAAAPFSLDAAFKSTIAGYDARPRSKHLATPSITGLTDPGEPEIKASCFFRHEDSPEQEMTNLQHSTCVLDISSDESEQKARRDEDEGRDKENMPPPDDISQTSTRRLARPAADDMDMEKECMALSEMKTADFYAEGCDEASVIIVPGDDKDEEPKEQGREAQARRRAAVALDAKADAEAFQNVVLLMFSPSDGSLKAAALHPMEGTGENFELWESGNVKDESEAHL